MSRVLLLTVLIGLPAAPAPRAEPAPASRYALEAQVEATPAPAARFGVGNVSVTPVSKPRFSVEAETKGAECAPSASTIFRNGFED